MTAWYDDDDLWEATYPFMFPQESYVSASLDVERLMALTGCREGSVLDLCCGPGRHSVPLAAAGFAVTGVDLSSFLLDKAALHAAERGVSVEWVRGDMAAFVREESYDLALSLFTSFGYHERAADNLRVLENVHASLRPGGIFVLDVMSKERLARVFEATGAIETETGGVRFERRRVIDDWSRLEHVWTVVDDGVAREYAVRHWIFSGQELKRWLEDAGFERVDLAGDLDGSPYGIDARRLVAIARKAPVA